MKTSKNKDLDSLHKFFETMKDSLSLDQQAFLEELAKQLLNSNPEWQSQWLNEMSKMSFKEREEFKKSVEELYSSALNVFKQE